MTTKSLGDLDVAEVTAWLVSMRLNNAFADKFVEQQIDGDCLLCCEESDFDRAGMYLMKIHPHTNNFVHARLNIYKFACISRICEGPRHALEEILVSNNNSSNNN